MSNINTLDRFEIPETLTDADAEYVRIKLSRCDSEATAVKLQTQLQIIERHLLEQHNALLKRIRKSV